MFHSSLSSHFGSVPDVSEAGHDAEKPPAIDTIEVNDSEDEQHVTEAWQREERWGRGNVYRISSNEYQHISYFTQISDRFAALG